MKVNAGLAQVQLLHLQHPSLMQCLQAQPSKLSAFTPALGQCCACADALQDTGGQTEPSMGDGLRATRH